MKRPEVPNDEEFVRFFGLMYNEFMKNLDDNDYVINLPQWAKMVSVLEYFDGLAKKSHGFVEPVNLRPKEESGSITLYVTVLGLSGVDVQEFCDMLSKCISFSLDATTDGQACLSVCIADVFMRKK